MTQEHLLSGNSRHEQPLITEKHDITIGRPLYSIVQENTRVIVHDDLTFEQAKQLVQLGQSIVLKHLAG